MRKNDTCTTRTLIYAAYGREAAAQVSAELARLEALYLKTHKRKLDPAILSISSWGDRTWPAMGLTAYVETPEQAEAARYLRSVVMESELLAA